MNSTGTEPGDFNYAVFHQPNIKFPHRVAKSLGFENDQIKDGMLVSRIGNTYAGSALVGLTAVLDKASPGEKVLLVSYGSGAGSDAFIMTTTENLVTLRRGAPDTESYISRRTEIDYATYARFRGKLVTK
jgi:hydroxymethylglutaryl-CoA synthase